MTEAKENALAMGIILVTDEPDDFEVWPECFESVELFMALKTQWHFGGLGGRAPGLDYQALKSAMDMMGVEDTAQAFRDIRVMEHEALGIWHKQSR
jgi:hypothetical protein